QQILSENSATAASPAPNMPGQLPAVSSNGEWVFKTQVNEVTVMFTAMQKGKYVSDLQRQDVEVQDDKSSPAEIMDFRNEQGLPLRLGLLVDTSGSVDNRFHYEMQAASQLVRQVVDQQHDQVFVAGFSHRPRVTQDFTNDPAKVSRGLGKLHDDQGDTAVFDAVVSACKKLAESGDRQPVARVLVLISDGDDNASTESLKDAAEIAQWDEVTIYTISSNPHGLNPIGDEALEKMAEQSGGRPLFAGSKKQVVKAFARIRDELRNRYAVSYRPAEFKPDGHFRHIRIVAKRFGKKLHVHARKGYYARPVLADVVSASPRP
ncbi:MAG TPA: VWA domain-containing protein, partial [Terriglobales bacterium]|nr:VWA domain-containing protein [Terriglobales bacterium]